jgi:hypothetical protein
MVYGSLPAPFYLSEKSVVEYTFKSSSRDKVRTIILGQHSFKIQSAEREEVIPYARVNSVRLSKMNGNRFCITLSAEGQKPISICNQYYLPDGRSEDRSRQYTAFVRVLHYHLKTNSHSVFFSGFSFHLLWIWVLTSAFAGFFVSFISEYFGISLMNPFGQALILTIMFTTGMLLINRGRLPKTYSPEEIPLQYLP